MKYSGEDLENRMKLVVRELREFPDENSLNEVPYWRTLLESVKSESGSLDIFYSTRIGRDFLTANEVDFPSEDQNETVTQMIENPRLLNRDCAGAGKTAPAIKTKFALEQLVYNGQRVNALVVCPNFVLSSWKSKTEQYMDRKPNLLTITSSNRESAIQEFDRGIREGSLDFSFVSYNALFRVTDGVDPDSIKAIEKERLITDFTLADRLLESLDRSDNPFVLFLDECQNSKNPEALRSKAVRKLAIAADHFYPLSGTIFPDNLDDIGELASLLDSENYPTAQHFIKAYDRNPRLIRMFLKRFGKEPVLTQKDIPGIPGISDPQLVCYELPGLEREIYDSLANFREINPGTKLTLLRLAAFDPRLLLPSLHQGGKLEERLVDFFKENPHFSRIREPEFVPQSYLELDQLVDQAIARGEKVVIWSKYREGVTKELEKRYRHYGSCRIDGEVSSDPKGKRFSERDIVRLTFQTNPDLKVLGGTIDSLREGQDLHSANNDVFVIRDYSPGPNEQATGRIARRGQTRTVNEFTLLANGTANFGASLSEADKRESIELVEKAVELTPERKELFDRKKPAHKRRDMRPYTMNSHMLVRLMSGHMTNMGGGVNEGYLSIGENARLYAAAYNFKWNTSYSAHTARLISQLVLELEKETGNRLERIADICSGPATISRTLERSSTCVDINPFQLNIGEDECRRLDFDIRTIQANAEDLSMLEDGSYDLGVMSLGLHYGECERGGRKRMVLELGRIVNKYAVLALPPSIVQGEGRELLEQGLTVLGLEPVKKRTGFVKAVDSRKDYRVYIAVCEKTHTNPPGLYTSDDYNGLFVLNPEFFYKTFDQLVEEQGSGGGGGKQVYSSEVCRRFQFENGDLITVGSDLDIKEDTITRAEKMKQILDKFLVRGRVK